MPFRILFLPKPPGTVTSTVMSCLSPFLPVSATVEPTQAVEARRDEVESKQRDEARPVEEVLDEVPLTTTCEKVEPAAGPAEEVQLFSLEEIEAMQAKVKVAEAPWVAAEMAMQKRELEENRIDILRKLEVRKEMRDGGTNLLRKKLFSRVFAQEINELFAANLLKCVPLFLLINFQDLSMKERKGLTAPVMTQSPHVPANQPEYKALPLAKLTVHTTKFRNPNAVVHSLVTQLPDTAGLPPSSMWTVLKSNYKVEDDPFLRFLPYFGDDDHEDIVSEVFNIRRQKDAEHLASVERTESRQLHALKQILFAVSDLVPNLDPVPNDVLEKKEDPLVKAAQKDGNAAATLNSEENKKNDPASELAKDPVAVAQAEDLIPAGPEKAREFQLLAVALGSTEVG